VSWFCPEWFRILRAEMAPILLAGWETVEREGCMIEAMGSSLKPITANCWGTSTPIFLAHMMALTAAVSLAEKMPSGGCSILSNFLVALCPSSIQIGRAHV